MSNTVKPLNDLIVDASAVIREINDHPDYKNLVKSQQDESFAPAADAYGAIAEISGTLHAYEKKK